MRVSNSYAASYAARAKVRAKARRVQRTINQRVVQDFAMLIIAALIFIGTGIVSLAADAAPAEAAAPPRMERPEGGLFLRAPGGNAMDRPAPTVSESVKIDISGAIARVKVVQTFANPDGEWVEGVYVFPLSRKSAVDHMLMRIGDRIVEGRIEERKAAKKRYEAARRSGRKASLVEQERPNIFTASIANIPPNESITVELSYQEPVTIEDGRYSVRFPMVVNPRYVPNAPQVAGAGGMGWGVNTVSVPDAERITPPMRDPALPRENPVRITADLDPGMRLAFLKSPYHDVQVSETGEDRFRIILRQGEVPADRDFVLEWQPEPGAAPQATLFKETVDGEIYLLAMVTPPTREARAEIERLPREAVFVIDTSGSMHGASIAQAQEALRFALDRLQPGDRFNVIAFESKPTPLFAMPQPADQRSIATAHIFVKAMQAQGGTEMRRALDLALDNRIDASRLRQIVLLTDGSVGNEAELFRIIRRGIGDSRLFTVGIGSAPNAYFMNKAARFGRGTFTFIGKTTEVTAKMTRLFRKLGDPVLTDLVAAFPDDAATDVQPDRIPDLYMGEPIVISARLKQAAGAITITGRRASEEWATRLDLAAARPAKGVAKLWAKRKTEALMEELHEGVDAATVRQAVLQVALPHQIMSRYTSLVAVDKPVSRPAQEGMTSRAVPANPPAGWTPPKAAQPGALPGAAPQHDRAQPDANMRRLAQATPAGPTVAPMVQRPGQPGAMIRLNTQTATPAALHLTIGALLISLALAVWFFRRRLVR